MNKNPSKNTQTIRTPSKYLHPGVSRCGKRSSLLKDGVRNQPYFIGTVHTWVGQYMPPHWIWACVILLAKTLVPHPRMHAA